MPSPAFAATDGYVQYKISWANLPKCGFQEHTNADPPRVHMYHQRVTHQTYGEHCYAGGCSTTNVQWYKICGTGSSSVGTYGPGCSTNIYYQQMDITNTELGVGWCCYPTNFYTGTWIWETEINDTRSANGTACDGSAICKTNGYSSEYRPLTAQLLAYGSSTFSADDITALPSFVGWLKQQEPTNHLSPYLVGQLSAYAQNLVAGYTGGTNLVLQQTLANDLNNIISGDPIYTTNRFEGVTLRQQTQDLLATNPQGPQLARLNRMLLEDACPLVLACGSSPFCADDIINLSSFASSLKEQAPTNYVSPYVTERLSSYTTNLLAEYGGGTNLVLQAALVNDLNTIISGESIYETSRFQDVTLRQQTQDLLATNPQGPQLARLNRLLLEDAYPLGLSTNFQYSGSPTWCWVGYDHVAYSGSGCQPWDNVTNDTTTGWTQPLWIPSTYGWEETARTLTHLELATSWADTNAGCGIDGSYTCDLSDEYTDGELRANILTRMPDYPQDWHTPTSESDIFLTLAYSVINGNHVDAECWWYPYQPQLQKMLYRFAIPASQAGVTYYVSWDVITWNTTTGDVSVNGTSCSIPGSGDPLEPAYSTNYEVMPPYWDDSREDCGGLVISFVDNVRISTAPGGGCGASDGVGGLPGGPGPLFLVSSSSAGEGCDDPCGSRPSGRTGVGASFSMGSSASGSAAGSLVLSRELPSPSLATPAALAYTAISPGVQVFSISNQIRQVNAPQALADIVTINPFAYEIRYYLPAQVGGTNNDGVYQVSGTNFVTWRIENPDASATTYNRLRITETRGSKTRTFDYAYTNAAGTATWKLIYPGGIREDEQTVSVVTNETTIPLDFLRHMGTYSMPGLTRTVTSVIRAPGGADQFKSRQAYQMTAWGLVLVEETLDPDTNPQTTTYSYDESYPDVSGKPRLQTITRPDGSWQLFHYDGCGRQEEVRSALGNLALDADKVLCTRTYYDYGTSLIGGFGDTGTLNTNTPRCILQHQYYHEFGNGNGEIVSALVASRFAVFPSADLRIDIENTIPSPYIGNPPNSLFTTNRYYTNGPNANRLKSIVRPDGTLQTFDYAVDATGWYRTNMTATGQPDSTFSRVIDGTTNFTVVNLAGYSVLSVTRDVTNGVVLSQDTYSNFDDFGRPQRVTHLDGTYEDTYHDCCGLASTTDRDGVLTQYSHDPLKRQAAATRLGITTTNALDAAGRTLKTVRIGSDATQLTQSQSRYNLAGQTIAETNALGGGTVYSQTTNAAGALVRTTTYPDGGTRIENYYRDGTLESVTGTAVHGVRYEHDIETYEAGDNGNRYTLEIKLKDNGTDSDEWTKTYTDAAGRLYKTLYSDDSPGNLADNPYSQSWYNNQGQLWKERDPDDVITFYAYNPKGELEYTITALDSTTRALASYDDLLTWLSGNTSGADRITRTVRTVVAAAGDKLDLVRADTYVWEEGETTGTLVSRVETLTDGSQSWHTTYPDGSTPLTNHSQTIYGANHVRTVTTTAADNSYTISVYSNGQPVSLTRYDSTAAQIGRATYGSDAHGRQSTVTDARNGATTFGYNAADLVVTVTTPNPGTPGGAPQITTTAYNNLLQATSVLNPDRTGVTNDYYLTGELKRQYGSRTYPVGYGYDYAGRMIKMTNWSGFPSTSPRVTTWNYNSCRGWLDSKRYPDGQGPDYTYTPGGRLKTRTWARTGTDENRIVTTYTYAFENEGGAGDLIEIAYTNDPQNTPGVCYTHDRMGRPHTVTRNGITTTLTYNLAGEQLSENSSGGTLDGVSLTSAYDQYLRRTNLSAHHSSTPLLQHSFTYDNASRLQSVTDSTGATAYSATYNYLANSPLVSQIVFQQGATTRMTTTKQWDNLNRLTQIHSVPSVSSAVSSSYAYNAANQRVRSTLADGSYWLYEYDSWGQVKSGKKYWPDQTPVAGQQFEYSFDDIGNRTQTKAGGDETAANLRSANYSANSLNQYTSRTVPGAVDIMGLSFATNTVTVNGQTAYRKGEYFRAEVPISNGSAPAWQSVTVNATNQSDVTGNVFVPKTPETFSYDADGNLTNDGRWTYTWDAENRLVKLAARTNVGPQNSIQFEYDWRGRRIRKQVWDNPEWDGTPTNDVKFVYDGWNLIATLDSQSSILQSFVWGLDLSGTLQGAGGIGGLLFICHLPSAIGYCTPAYDGNGNVVALISLSGATNCAAYEYGPFGEVIRMTGPLAKANPFRFSTKYQDDETDLVYYGYRYYNASTGRWLSRDPIGQSGGFNLYTFVQNKAISSVDVVGLATYSLVNLPPSGLWGVTVADVDVQGGMTWRGFHSRYLPSDGRVPAPNPQPVCPCKKENIILVQVVKEPWHGGRLQFDVGKPGYLPPHKPDDPIPGYYWDSNPSGPLTIVDAPNTSGASGTWEFEDCAVCRTHPAAGTTLDQVLGCVKFVFHRTSDTKAEISVQRGPFGWGGFVYAQAPGRLWREAVQDWRSRGQ